MTATDRRILKPVLLAISLGLMLLALAPLAANGPPSASADGSDVKIEETCGPYVFRPNEWVVYQCLIRATNTGDEPARDIVTSITGSSGIILDAYFILFEVDGSPLPIEPTAKSFSAGGELAPGVTANVRLLVLLKTTEEGAYDAVWTTRANGDVVFTDPIHYEARDDAEAPPTGLSVEQVGRSRGRQAIFTTTITNHSSSSVTRLLLMKHYGPNGVEPLERQVAELLLEGKSNAAICAEVFLSRARVQECIKRILIKTKADSTRGAIVLLAEERENLSLLHVLSQATDGVGILQDRVFKFANKAFAETCGYDPDEMVGMPFVELVAPRIRDRAAGHYELRMKGEPFPRSYTTTVLRKGGQEKELMVANAGLIRFRGRPAIMVIASDSLQGGGQ